MSGSEATPLSLSEAIYDVPVDWAKRAWIDHAKYYEMYERLIKDPDGFWAEQAKRLNWTKTHLQNAKRVRDTCRYPVALRSRLQIIEPRTLAPRRR